MQSVIILQHFALHSTQNVMKYFLNILRFFYYILRGDNALTNDTMFLRSEPILNISFIVFPSGSEFGIV